MTYYHGVTLLEHRAVVSRERAPAQSPYTNAADEGRSLREILPTEYQSVARSAHSDAYRGAGYYKDWHGGATPHGWNETGDPVAGAVAKYTMLDCCGLKELVFTASMGQTNGGWGMKVGQTTDLCVDPTMPARIWMHLLFERLGIMGTMSTAAVSCHDTDRPDPGREFIGKVKWLREYKSWVALCAEHGVAPWNRSYTTTLVPETRDFLEGKSEYYRNMLHSKEVFALVSVFDWIEWQGLGKVKPMPAYQNKNSSNIIYPLFMYPTMSRDENKRSTQQVMWDTYSAIMPVIHRAHQNALDQWLDVGRIRDISNRYDMKLNSSFKIGAEVTNVPESVVSPFLRQAVKFDLDLHAG